MFLWYKWYKILSGEFAIITSHSIMVVATCCCWSACGYRLWSGEHCVFKDLGLFRCAAWYRVVWAPGIKEKVKSYTQSAHGFIWVVV